jgi:hypothetical protein
MVGHVLAKVDAKDGAVSDRLGNLWPQLKTEPIFRDFIDASRNRAVKEYELDLYDASSVVVVSVNEQGREFPSLLNQCTFMPLLDGYKAGEDARDVFREAIMWWEQVLRQIEGS